MLPCFAEENILNSSHMLTHYDWWRSMWHSTCSSRHKQFKHNKSSHLPCCPKTENKMKNQSHSHFHSENNMKKQELAHFQVGINAEVTLLLLQTKVKFLLALEKKIWGFVLDTILCLLCLSGEILSKGWLRLEAFTLYIVIWRCKLKFIWSEKMWFGIS